MLLVGLGYDAADSADFAWYCDSGEALAGGICSGPPPTVRTARPYPLERGTTFRLVDVAAPGLHWDEFTVICDPAPAHRGAPFAEPVYAAVARVTAVRGGIAIDAADIALTLYPARPGQWWIDFAGTAAPAGAC